MADNSELWEAAQEAKARMLEQERAFIASMLALWAVLQARLETLYTRLYEDLAAAQASGSAPMSKARLRDLEITQIAIAETLIATDALAAQWADMIANRQREVIAQGEEDGNRMLEIAGIMAGLFLLLPASWYGTIGADGVAGILDRVLSGKKLRDLMAKRIGEAVGKAMDTVLGGIASGAPISDVIKTVLGDLGQIAEAGVLIGATETNRPYRYTLQDIFLATRAPLLGYRRVATLDTRTCLACIMADGRFYKLDEAFEEHPRGRCILVPVFAGQENSVPWERGEQWFLDLPAETQRQMMGDSRYQKWKDGDFALSDLITVIANGTYGPSLNPTPNKDL